MNAAGVELVADLNDLAVMGFWEVLQRLRALRRVERRVMALLTDLRPSLVLLVDFPGLNLRVARAAHALGLPVLYYIAPKAWAWRPHRARRLAQATDRVALVLPFEPEFFAPYGVRLAFVGHPLLDRPDDVPDRKAFCDRWGLDPERPLLALLPGSRDQELRRHIEPFAGIAEWVCAARPDVLPVFSRAPTASALQFHDTGLPVVGETRALLRHASAAVVASGTATLEAALEETPMVIAYRTSAPTAFLARRFMNVEYVGLPNLVASRPIVPEFLQEDVSPEVMGPAILDLLDESSERRIRQIRELGRMRGRLGTPGASDRVVELADELLAEGA
jgi:lipid-A-disaccharide synthase